MTTWSFFSSFCAGAASEALEAAGFCPETATVPAPKKSLIVDFYLVSLLKYKSIFCCSVSSLLL
jgi:hypothetical protein